MNDISTRECFGCGRLMERAHRIFKKESYCGTCYAREFKRKPCPKCGEMARLPERHPNAICSSCEKRKPCVRCGNERYRLGLMSEYGPVCMACARYFSEELVCSRCGSVSRHLSRVQRLGFDEPVCPRCARADHACCQACGRSRRLQDAPNGQKLCSRCLALGAIPCSKCGCPMPAGLGDTCTNCYWQQVFEQRLHFNQGVLHPPVQELYQAFSRWLLGHCGAHRSSRLLARYLAFFESIQLLYINESMSYQQLVKQFGADILRRHRLAVRWLIDSHGWVEDGSSRLEDSEARGIERLLLGVSDPLANRLLVGYYQYLRTKHQQGGLSLRSVRLALTPAKKLLGQSLKAGRSIPDQKDLCAYISQYPGQKAAVHGFITYLNREQHAALDVRQVHQKKHKNQAKAVLEKRLAEMVQMSRSDKAFQNMWAITALAYFHGLSNVSIRQQIAKEGLEDDGDGLTFHHEGLAYWIPKCSIKL